MSTSLKSGKVPLSARSTLPLMHPSKLLWSELLFKKRSVFFFLVLSERLGGVKELHSFWICVEAAFYRQPSMAEVITRLPL